MQHQQHSQSNKIHPTKAIIATSLPSNKNTQYEFNYDTLTKQSIAKQPQLKKINGGFIAEDEIIVNEDTYCKNFFLELDNDIATTATAYNFVDDQQFGYMYNEIKYIEIAINNTIVYRETYPPVLNLLLNKDKKSSVEKAMIGLPYQVLNNFYFQSFFGHVMSGVDYRNPAKNNSLKALLLPLFWLAPFFNNPEIIPAGTKLNYKFVLSDILPYIETTNVNNIYNNAIIVTSGLLKSAAWDKVTFVYCPIRKYTSLNQSLQQPFYKYSSLRWENIINYYPINPLFVTERQPFIVNKTFHIRMRYPDYLMFFFNAILGDERMLFYNEYPFINGNFEQVTIYNGGWLNGNNSLVNHLYGAAGLNTFFFDNQLQILNFRIFLDGELVPIFDYNYNNCKCSFDDYIRREQYCVDNYLTQEYTTIQRDSNKQSPYILNMRNIISSKFLKVAQNEMVPFVFEFSIIRQDNGVPAINNETYYQFQAYVPQTEDFIIQRVQRTCNKL